MSAWVIALAAPGLLVACVACPPGYHAHGLGCYMWTNEVGNFTECQQGICARANGTLASVHSFELHRFLAKLSLDGELHIIGYVGLYERGQDESGDWVWSDGSNLSLPLWNTGQPDNWCLDEDCAVMTDSGWSDISCSAKAHCLCQHGGHLSTDYLEHEPHLKNNTDLSTYLRCFELRKHCWWFGDWMFRSAFLLLCVLCTSVICFAMQLSCRLTTGDTPGSWKPSIRDHVLGPSLYGGLLNSTALADKDDVVDLWVVRGAWGAILYSVALFMLALTTMLHIRSGVSFGFALDTFEVLVMFTCKLAVGFSTFIVHKHLSPRARLITASWVLVLALANILLALWTLTLAMVYARITISGTREANGSYCSVGIHFSETLLLTMVLESISGLAWSCIHSRAASHLEDPSVFTQIVGCSWTLLVSCTFGVAVGMGACCAVFVFDDPEDDFSPIQALGLFYLAAACCEFLAGAAMLRANLQVKAFFAGMGMGSRLGAAMEMASDATLQAPRGARAADAYMREADDPDRFEHSVAAYTLS